MTDENVQCTPVLDAVADQGREHFEGSQVGFELRILVDAVGTISNGATKAADQEFFVAHSFQIQVDSTFSVGLIEIQVKSRVVVARHVKHRHVQYRDQIFQIFIGHVTAANDEFHILKMTTGCEGVDTIDDLVANGKNFHSSFILP